LSEIRIRKTFHRIPSAEGTKYCEGPTPLFLG
jgi:hypothetical protein